MIPLDPAPGCVCAEWGTLTLFNLTALSLADNRLSGTLPAWQGTFPELKTLNLKGNNISGPVPPGVPMRPNQMPLALCNVLFAIAVSI